MKVYAAVRRGVGKKECEDTVIVGDKIIFGGELEIEGLINGAICVADGVGGNTGAHFASNFVIEGIKNIAAKSNASNLAPLLKEINFKLIQEANANGFPAAATTLTGIILGEKNKILVHIGNTRAYVLQGKYLKQLTEDDTLYNYLLKMGKIEEAAASNKNIITNCFGAGNTVFLESLSISQIQDFSYMLLTSDGVHDYIKIDELEHLLTDQPSSIKTCLNIIQAALNAGSKDDISVVIIKE